MDSDEIKEIELIEAQESTGQLSKSTSTADSKERSLVIATWVLAVATVILAIATGVTVYYSFRAFGEAEDAAKLTQQTATLERAESVPAISMDCEPTAIGKPRYRFSVLYLEGYPAFSEVVGRDALTTWQHLTSVETCHIYNDGKLPAETLVLDLEVSTHLSSAKRPFILGKGQPAPLLIPHVAGGESITVWFQANSRDSEVSIAAKRDCRLETTSPILTPACRLPRTDLSAPIDYAQNSFLLAPLSNPEPTARH